MVNSDYLKNLNQAQKQAVLALDGPLLLVAGLDLVNKSFNKQNCTHNKE